MFLLFHTVIPLVLILPFKKLNIKYNLFWLFIGSAISDIVDKSAEFFNIWSGRGVAHTLLFLIVTLIFLQSIKKDKTITFSYSIGFIIHIVMDFPLPVFFYPLVGEIDFMLNPYINFSRIDFFIVLLLSNKTLIITELIGFVCLALLGSYVLIKKYRKKGIGLKLINEFIKREKINKSNVGLIVLQNDNKNKGGN